LEGSLEAVTSLQPLYLPPTCYSSSVYRRPIYTALVSLSLSLPFIHID
jgi:hypothetical protein